MLYPTAFFTNNHVSLHIYKNKLPMKILYYIYQICIALPILLVLTILTAIVTIVGSLLGGAHFWGYYPGKIWSQLICLFLLIPVKIHGREKLREDLLYLCAESSGILRYFSYLWIHRKKFQVDDEKKPA